MEKKITIKNKELVMFYEGLMQVKKHQGPKFAYAVFRNINEVSPLYTAISNASRQPVNDEYEKKRIEHCTFYAVKDENGKPVIKNNRYEMLAENRRNFDIACRESADETGYSEQLNKFKAELDRLLELEQEITVNTVKEDCLPAGISGEDLLNINYMIE